MSQSIQEWSQSNFWKTALKKFVPKQTISSQSSTNFTWSGLNPLSANPTKWSNTLKQFVGC